MSDDPILDRLLEELTEAANAVSAHAASHSEDSNERERLWLRYRAAEDRVHARMEELAGESSE